MANTVVIGMQWGDEGKGKIVDLLCPAFDAVVRFQGGDNAGHTVKFGDRHFALHLVPSGILHEGMRCVLGNGMVINPDAFFRELEALAAAGVETEGRLFISSRAHVLMPFHAELDRAREAARGKRAIGTTSRGIGPAYEAKASRYGLRLCDLAAAGKSPHLDAAIAKVAAELAGLGARATAADSAERASSADPAPSGDRGASTGPEGQAGAEKPVGPGRTEGASSAPSIDRAAEIARCRDWAERLAPYARETAYLLNAWIERGESLLFEGAQGTLLDLDHGTYPYVTSSSASAGGAATGTGVAPGRIDGVLGVLKAYTTRVGGGPFVTELEDETGRFLRERGNEFGTTTGRPRRCGWFDAVVARHSRMINGVDAIALTKLDVLDRLDEIRVCVAYRIDGHERRGLPPTAAELERAEPVYRTVPGWGESTVGSLVFEDLPPKARDYLALLEEEVGVPIAIISTGPRREETIIRDGAALDRLTSSRLEEIRRHRDA